MLPTWTKPAMVTRSSSGSARSSDMVGRGRRAVPTCEPETVLSPVDQAAKGDGKKRLGIGKCRHSAATIPRQNAFHRRSQAIHRLIDHRSTSAHRLNTPETPEITCYGMRYVAIHKNPEGRHRNDKNHLRPTWLLELFASNPGATLIKAESLLLTGRSSQDQHQIRYCHASGAIKPVWFLQVAKIPSLQESRISSYCVALCFLQSSA